MTAAEIAAAAGITSQQAARALVRLRSDGSVLKDVDLVRSGVHDGSCPRVTAVYGVHRKHYTGDLPRWLAPYPEIKVWSSLFHKTDDEVDDEAAA